MRVASFGSLILPALVCLLVGSQAGAQLQVPSFQAGDLDAVTCRVVQLGGTAKFVRWLEVEVHNTGQVACEPLTFEVRLAGKNRKAPARIERFERTKRPRTQRFGRPTLAGQKQRYFLATGLVGDRRKYSVRIINASFHDGPAVAKPTLLDGKLRQIRSSSLVGTFSITRVPLRNPFAHDLDAIFRVTLKQPADVTELFAVRIPANSQLDWDLYARPGAVAYLHPEPAPATPVRATKLELVDWVLAAPPDEDAAKEAFGKAYRRWVAWPADKPTVSGEYEHIVKRQKVNSTEYVEQTATGRFTIASDGTVTVADADKTKASAALERAFADVHRKPLATVLDENRFFFIDRNYIEVVGPGFQSKASHHAQVAGGKASNGTGDSWWYAVDGARLTGYGWGEGLPFKWQARNLGTGYVITQKATDSSTIETFDYRANNGLIAPSRWTTETVYGNKLFAREELRIMKLTTKGEHLAQHHPATGDGAAALRAIWDAAPRVTQEPIVVTANIEVRTPATDALWQGHKKITGKLRMRGVGRHCSQLELKLGRSFSPELERSLASAVYDRFLLWFGKDLNDRLPFDDYFAGARIDRPTAGGIYRVHQGPVAAVGVNNGRIQYLELEKGVRRKFSYKRRGDVAFVERFTLGKAQTHITLTEVSGHILPTKLHFVKCLGPTWGPETITLRNIRVAEAPK